VISCTKPNLQPSIGGVLRGSIRELIISIKSINDLNSVTKFADDTKLGEMADTLDRNKAQQTQSQALHLGQDNLNSKPWRLMG